MVVAQPMVTDTPLMNSLIQTAFIGIKALIVILRGSQVLYLSIELPKLSLRHQERRIITTTPQLFISLVA